MYYIYCCVFEKHTPMQETLCQYFVHPGKQTLTLYEHHLHLSHILVFKFLPDFFSVDGAGGGDAHF